MLPKKLSKHLIALLAMMASLMPSLAKAQEATSEAVPLSIDAQINQAFAPISNAFADIIFYSVKVGDTNVPLIVGWLFMAALIFTFYFKFLQIRGFRHAVDLVCGKYSSQNDPGQITHFQALATALSGTVGLGNIAGVAVAVSVGGAGATFWMILAGFLGMAPKCSRMQKRQPAPGQGRQGPFLPGQ